MRYFFFAKEDEKREPIFFTWALTRLDAAKYFAQVKKLKLKQFLSIYGISK